MNTHLEACDIRRDLEERDLLALAERIAKAYGITVVELLSRTQARHVVHARHVLWGVLSRRGHWSQPRIGALFRRDHATVAHGLAKVQLSEVQRFETEEQASEPVVKLITYEANR